MSDEQASFASTLERALEDTTARIAARMGCAFYDEREMFLLSCKTKYGLEREEVAALIIDPTPVPSCFMARARKRATRAATTLLFNGDAL